MIKQDGAAKRMFEQKYDTQTWDCMSWGSLKRTIMGRGTTQAKSWGRGLFTTFENQQGDHLGCRRKRDETVGEEIRQTAMEGRVQIIHSFPSLQGLWLLDNGMGMTRVFWTKEWQDPPAILKESLGLLCWKYTVYADT